MTDPTAVNPFYTARMKRVTPRTEERERPVYARLPQAPRNASLFSSEDGLVLQ